MSIIVNLRYTGKNGSARAFAEEMTSSGTVDAIRNEDGNLRYVLSVENHYYVQMIHSLAVVELLYILCVEKVIKNVNILIGIFQQDALY